MGNDLKEHQVKSNIGTLEPGTAGFSSDLLEDLIEVLKLLEVIKKKLLRHRRKY
jgi:hypothetical protein